MMIRFVVNHLRFRHGLVGVLDDGADAEIHQKILIVGVIGLLRMIQQQVQILNLFECPVLIGFPDSNLVRRNDHARRDDGDGDA